MEVNKITLSKYGYSVALHYSDLSVRGILDDEF